MSRATWEAETMRRQFGDVLATRRVQERRAAVTDGLKQERRNRERRAVLDSAICSAWIARFEESRRALA